MENLTAEGRNYTRFEQSLIEEWNIFFAALNIFFSITASLSNALILIALHKVTSIYPPTKLLFRCLGVTDLCVGLISQPYYATTQLLTNSRYSIVISNISTTVLSTVSILTSTAISVDRLLALIMGIRYKQVVTLRRVRALISFFWILSCSFGTWIWFSLDQISLNMFVAFIILCLLTSIMSYTKIYLLLRHHQIQLHENLQQPGQPPNGGGMPLNVARYKKTVSSIAWVQLVLLVCFLPFSVVLFLSINDSLNSDIVLNVTISLFYVNSSLNPIIYCWKIKDVRQAVKDAVKFNCCPST